MKTLRSILATTAMASIVAGCDEAPPYTVKDVGNQFFVGKIYVGTEATGNRSAFVVTMADHPEQTRVIMSANRLLEQRDIDLSLANDVKIDDTKTKAEAEKLAINFIMTGVAPTLTYEFLNRTSNLGPGNLLYECVGAKTTALVALDGLQSKNAGAPVTVLSTIGSDTEIKRTYVTRQVAISHARAHCHA